MKVSANEARWKVSETVPIGDESIIMQSNISPSNLINSAVLSRAVSSEGFGGTGPGGNKNRFSYWVTLIIFS